MNSDIYKIFQTLFYSEGGRGDSEKYFVSNIFNKIARNHDLHRAEWNLDSKSVISHSLEIRPENPYPLDIPLATPLLIFISQILSLRLHYK